MTFDATRLFELLPTVYRLRDGEGVGDQKNALRALIDVIAIHSTSVLTAPPASS